MSAATLLLLRTTLPRPHHCQSLLAQKKKILLRNPRYMAKALLYQIALRPLRSWLFVSYSASHWELFPTCTWCYAQPASVILIFVSMYAGQCSKWACDVIPTTLKMVVSCLAINYTQLLYIQYNDTQLITVNYSMYSSPVKNL